MEKGTGSVLLVECDGVGVYYRITAKGSERPSALRRADLVLRHPAAGRYTQESESEAISSLRGSEALMNSPPCVSEIISHRVWLQLTDDAFFLSFFYRICILMILPVELPVIRLWRAETIISARTAPVRLHGCQRLHFLIQQSTNKCNYFWK